MTIYLVDLEKIQTRYTAQWADYVPKILSKTNKEIVIISGPDDLPDNTSPGMFLNFSATNIYKSAQVDKISRLFSDGKIKDGDYFLFTDAWHPGVINVKYMAELLNVKVKLGGLWHAGSYDEHDGLGRIIGNSPWVRHAEKSYYHCFDNNFFATHFHTKMFFDELLHNGYPSENPWYDEDLEDIYNDGKIVRAGWPMDYMKDLLNPYKNMPKKDIILFPHRIAPEKQVEIFRDLAKELPQYEFIVCQDKSLTKQEYHNLLGQSKMVFSANLQETLGISTCSEGPIAGAIPLAPDRLSYTEIFQDHKDFLYPSEWTQDWGSYLKYKNSLKYRITDVMSNYNNLMPVLDDYLSSSYENYFHADELISHML